MKEGDHNMTSRGMPVTKQMKLEKRKIAEEAKAEYDKLSLKQKIDRLPKDGAKKQRARLMELLSKSEAPQLESSKKDV